MSLIGTEPKFQFDRTNLFTCVSYEAKGVPMAARLQRGTSPASYVTSTGMPAQNAATILKPLVPNPYSTPSTHGATCC